MPKKFKKMSNQEILVQLTQHFSEYPTYSTSAGHNIYYNQEFLLQCVEQVKKLIILGSMGEQPNPLEILGFQILCKMAYVPLPDEDPK
jgi:hypothetical protein